MLPQKYEKSCIPEKVSADMQVREDVNIDTIYYF